MSVFYSKLLHKRSDSFTWSTPVDPKKCISKQVGGHILPCQQHCHVPSGIEVDDDKQVCSSGEMDGELVVVVDVDDLPGSHGFDVFSLVFFGEEDDVQDDPPN